MKNLVDLFPLSVYQADLGLSAEDRRQMAAAITQQKKEKILKKGAQNSWTGDVNGFVSLHTDPRFEKFFAALSPHFEKYIGSFGLRPADYRILLTRSWGTVTERSERILFHTHTRSDISVVYYLTYSENTGDLLFKNEGRQNEFTPGIYSIVQGHPRKHVVNMRSATTAKVTCREDLLLLFPSKTRHGTEPSESDETRVSIAVDTMITAADSTGEELLLPPIELWRQL